MIPCFRVGFWLHLVQKLEGWLGVVRLGLWMGCQGTIWLLYLARLISFAADYTFAVPSIRVSRWSISPGFPTMGKSSFLGRFRRKWMKDTMTSKAAALSKKGDPNASRFRLVVTISDWVDMVPVIQRLWLDMWLKFRCPNRSSNKAVDENQLHNAHSTPHER